MQIKPREENRTPVNIREWNETQKAYVKSLDIMERIVFNDQFLAYHDKTADRNDRAEAGLSICILALVDENGNPLLTLEDMEALKSAAFEPIGRVINIILASAENSAEEEAPANP